MRKPLFPAPRPTRVMDDQRVLPLINVVFLLLIFFMLAGRIEARDAFPVQPPLAEDPQHARSAELTVLIGEDGRIALDGADVTPGDLAGAIRHRLVETGAVTASVKADGGAAAPLVIDALAILRAAGLNDLRLLVGARRS